VEVVGDLTCIPVTRGGTRINHLFFVDNSLLFCRANLRDWGSIHSILRIYEAAFGQQLNRQKTSSLFSFFFPFFFFFKPENKLRG
jgi:hypothetical protein